MITAGLLFFTVRFLDIRSIDDAGLRINTSWLVQTGIGFLIALIAISVIFLLEWSTGMLYIIGFEWDRISPNYLAILAYLFQMISVGFYEEAAFRGVMLKNISEGFQGDASSSKKAVVTAIVFSSVLFGLAHAGNPNASLLGVLNIVLAGIMLSIPYIITGSLALSVGIHAGWNFVLGGVFGFNVSGTVFKNSLILINQDGNELWTGGAFGPEAGIMGLIGMSIIIMLLFLYLKLNKQEIELHSSFKMTYLQKVKILHSGDELSE